MKKLNVLGSIVLAIACGCSPDAGSGTTGGSVSMEGPPPATVDLHDHPSEGPHHGTLVELGKEEYHAEVTHDKELVTVYILDAQAKDQVSIESTEVSINLVHNGKPEQFKLAATPDTGDLPSRASRFTIASPDLAALLDDESVTPKITVTIVGKAYRGEIQHSHAGHDHAGHDHAGH